MPRFHPGCTEQEWLSGLKLVAERIGTSVLGRPIRWRVETTIAARRNRSEREAAAEDGLRTLFERYAASTRGAVPTVSVDEMVLGF